MYSRRNWNAVVGDFRPSRKSFSFNGSLLFLALFCIAAQQASCRPSQDDDLPSNFNVGDEFRDVDNLEIHHVKVVDGVEQEDHPIIMYKEDFVSEDYVASKNDTKSENPKRRYKDISHRRRHKQNFTTDVMLEEKPEKMLFDIIPETPLIVPEDLERPRKTHMKLVPLSEDISEESNSKSVLNKRPKKYHRRVRRDLSREHIVRKRNPYIRHMPKVAGDVPTQIQYIYVKHSVAGKKHNGLDIPITKAPPSTSTNSITNGPISFDTRVAADENDRVIFSGGKTAPRPTRRPVESIFRDPRPENFDYSFMNPQNSAATTRTPIPTSRPVTSRPPESIFRDPRPENFDFTFMNKAQQTQQSSAAATSATAPPASATQTISQCVWAIVNCCSGRNSQIRYSCFETNGCNGAFWDINPCADNVRENIVEFVADYYN